MTRVQYALCSVRVSLCARAVGSGTCIPGWSSAGQQPVSPCAVWGDNSRASFKLLVLGVTGM